MESPIKTRSPRRGTSKFIIISAFAVMGTTSCGCTDLHKAETNSPPLIQETTSHTTTLTAETSTSSTTSTTKASAQTTNSTTSAIAATDTTTETQTKTTSVSKTCTSEIYAGSEIYLPITESERIMLCNLVGREYGSDHVQVAEKAKVVAVVMNRVNSPQFPDTIYEVLTQPYQFSGYIASDTYSYQVTDSVIEAVDYYFSHTDEFGSWLYFEGDGKWNYFS